MYPNPVSGMLTIEYPKGEFEGESEVLIFNAQGIMVHKGELEPSGYRGHYQYNASGLVPGMYFVKLHDHQHDHVLRFVKAGQ